MRGGLVIPVGYATNDVKKDNLEMVSREEVHKGQRRKGEDYFAPLLLWHLRAPKLHTPCARILVVERIYK
jgi:hypothetical protein